MDPRKPMTFQQWLASQGKTLVPSSRSMPGERPPTYTDDIVRQPPTNDGPRVNCPPGYVESADHSTCISLYGGYDGLNIPQHTIGPAAGCGIGEVLTNGRCVAMQ